MVFAENKLLTITVFCFDFFFFLFSSTDGTAIAGELDPEGRERRANKALKYGRPEGKRSGHGPTSLYLLHVKQRISHRE